MLIASDSEAKQQREEIYQIIVKQNRVLRSGEIISIAKEVGVHADKQAIADRISALMREGKLVSCKVNRKTYYGLPMWIHKHKPIEGKLISLDNNSPS